MRNINKVITQKWSIYTFLYKHFFYYYWINFNNINKIDKIDEK